MRGGFRSELEEAKNLNLFPEQQEYLQWAEGVFYGARMRSNMRMRSDTRKYIPAEKHVVGKYKSFDRMADGSILMYKDDMEVAIPKRLMDIYCIHDPDEWGEYIKSESESILLNQMLTHDINLLQDELNKYRTLSDEKKEKFKHAYFWVYGVEFEESLIDEVESERKSKYNRFDDPQFSAYSD